MLLLMFFWSFFVVYRHLLPMRHAEHGDFGLIELKEIADSRILVEEFSAVKVPSRVVRLSRYLTWPVPEVMEVSVIYRDLSGNRCSWQWTYLLACDDAGDCQPIGTLRGVGLYRKGISETVFCQWIYFRDVAGKNPVPGRAGPPESPPPSLKKKEAPENDLAPHVLIVSLLPPVGPSRFWEGFVC